MNAKSCLTIILASLALSACTYGAERERKPVAPAATVIGEAVSCIPITQIRETRIRDDWTIDFIGNGSQVWRNTLPGRCSGLRSENKFSYETSLSQLCSTDIIHVLHQYGNSIQKGAGCGLGQFVPVKLEK